MEFFPHTARNERVLYSLWHRTILVNSYLYRDLGACIGVSQHADGEIGARIAERLGFNTARGSSTTGSTRLIREMLRFARREKKDLALTPDGPKGPSRKSKPGPIYLASRLGWPIVPTAIAARPAKIFQSWDRFILPFPFAKIVSVVGEPLRLDPVRDDAEVEYWCTELDRRMLQAEDRAQELLTS